MILLPQGPDEGQQAGADTGNVEMIHPTAVAALVALSVMALVLPRRWAFLPIAILMCFIPSGQRLLLFTLDFTFLRILVAVTWGRLLLRSELTRLSMNHMDRVYLWWTLVMTVAGLILEPTVPGLVNRLGNAFDALTIYFLFRYTIRTIGDLLRIGTAFAWISIPVLAFFVIENRTQYNAFSIFGGVPETTMIREGRLRCQGAFAHPILAGCFWAALLPIYALFGFVQGRWIKALLASVVALGLVMLCASSTPVMAVIFGVLAGAAYCLRRALPVVRWLAVATLVGLHMVMKAPVWNLIARIDVVGGSTGYHRYALIDAAIRHFPEWMLYGTQRTWHWGWGLGDVTNHYVAVGINGGIVGLLLFAAFLTLSFAGVSRSMRLPDTSTGYRATAWCLGCVQFMHCMNFLAVAYFGQITALWQLSLAAIASLCAVPRSQRRPAAAPDIRTGWQPAAESRAPVR